MECILPLPVDEALNMNMLVNCYYYNVITIMYVIRLTDVSTQLCQEHSNRYSITFHLHNITNRLFQHNIGIGGK